MAFLFDLQMCPLLEKLSFSKGGIPLKKEFDFKKAFYEINFLQKR